MAKKTTKQTKKPTGLSIARNGLTFTFSWKQGETYGSSQKLEYNLSYNWKWQGWNNLAVGKSTTSKSISFNPQNYHPYTWTYFTGIKFRVRGTASDTSKENKTVSDWTESSGFGITPPPKPNVSVTMVDSLLNKRDMSWSCPFTLDDNSPFAFVEFQTAFAQDFLGWGSPTVVWSESYTVAADSWSQEDTEFIPIDTSYARCIRARARGAGGDSEWNYAFHVFTTPLKAIILGANIDNGIGSFHGRVAWIQPWNLSKPVDTMEVQYLVGVPTEVPVDNKGCPSSGWTGVGTLAVPNAEGYTEYDFNTDVSVGTDECVWMQIKTSYDKKTANSNAYLAYTGELAKPTFISGSPVSTDDGTILNVSANHNTEIQDSFILVSIAIKNEPNTWYNIGILPKNRDSDSFKCPDIGNNDYIIKIQEFVGSYTETDGDGYKLYNVNGIMKSAEVKSDSEGMPLPPREVKAVQVSASSVKLSWDWKWKEANEVVISWSDHEDAWESTDGPEEYEIDHKVTSWTVAKLDSDKQYYFRVRLKNTGNNTEIMSAWSNPITMMLSSELVKPSISVNNNIVNIDDVLIFTCSYSSSGDASVQIAEFINGVADNSTIIASEKSSVVNQSISDINAILETNEKPKWETGSTHTIVCRIIQGNVTTDWSDPIVINIIPSINIGTVNHSLTNASKEDEDGNIRNVLSLKELPLIISTTGAGKNGNTKAYVVRAANYSIARPTEKNEERFEGEIVAGMAVEGESEISIFNSDLIGNLDDGASYNLVVQIEDMYGQTASQIIPFEVNWLHQPELPVADIRIENDYKIAIISVSTPESYTEGDTFDVYRLSADYPELILHNCEYGKMYVDPYPAFGRYGGHRIVNKTINNDYITSENVLAWSDMGEDEGDYIESKKAVINFDGREIELEYNLDFSNSWKKDFKQTVYLGGSITGDWNPGIIRTLTLDTVHLNVFDDNVIENMRRLAVYTGICHVRTPDGSSFPCDIQVTEKKNHDNKFRHDYSLSITRIDQQGYDGMTLEDWSMINGLE